MEPKYQSSNLLNNNETMDSKRYIYTVYSIVPVKNTENSATYKQIAKYYCENHLCFKINELRKKKYDQENEAYKYELFCIEEIEKNNTSRDTKLRKNILMDLIKNTYTSIDITQILNQYKNNNALLYSDESLYNYMNDTSNNFFVTVSYITE